MSRTQTGGPGEGDATRIRQAGPRDLAALGDFFAGLSPGTRYLRFFAPITPTRAMLRRLCGEAGTADAVVATAGGVIIGHAMAAGRGQAGPPGCPATDIGVVVADAWQGRGVGSALVRTLTARAQARGVTLLAMDVLPGNHRVLAMIARHWAVIRTEESADCLTVHVRLAQQQRSPARPAGQRPAA